MLVLLTTVGLTVLFDLTNAVGTGILLSSILFMRRMAQVSTIAGIREEIEEGEETESLDPKDPGKVAEKRVPAGVRPLCAATDPEFGCSATRATMTSATPTPRIVRPIVFSSIHPTSLNRTRRSRNRAGIRSDSNERRRAGRTTLAVRLSSAARCGC